MAPRPLTALCIVCASLVTSGCFDALQETSCDYMTREISAVANVIDRGMDLRAEIDFEAGDRRSMGEELSLCKDDVLTINGEQPMAIDKADRVVYSVTFAALDTREVVFSLRRDRGRDNVELRVSVPPVFTITSPEAGEEVTSAEEQVLTWTPANAGGQVQVELTEAIGDGICLRTPMNGHGYKDMGGILVPDEGQWNIPRQALENDTEEPCEATYRLTRFLLGQYPDSLQAGGRIEARVEREVDFRSVP